MATITYRNRFIIGRGYHFVQSTDDFMTPSTEDGEIGELRWALGAGSVEVRSPELDHPGIVRLKTGTTCGTVARIFTIDITTSALATGTFVLRPLDVASAAYRIGVMSTPGVASEASVGVYFSFDATKASTWRAVTRDTNGVSVTQLSTPVTVSAWYQLELIQDGGPSAMKFLINGRLCAIHSGFIATSPNVNDAFVVENLEAADKALDIDFFERETVLSEVRYP